MTRKSLRQLIDHACRWSHSLGFGVQSTSAYRFIRYVVNERCPYYGYADLRERYPGMSEEDRRRGELLLRLANHVQPGLALLFGHGEVARDYILAGCRKARVELMKTGFRTPDYRRLLATLGNVDLCCVAAVAGNQDFLQAALNRATPRSIFLVEGINGSEEAKTAWQSLVSDPRVGVSYDLKSFGLLCFDHRVYKQDFKISF